MSLNIRRGLFFILLAAIAVSSCKKQFSSDSPLPTTYSPSIIIGSDNQVFYALNPYNGAKNWQFALPSLNNFVPLDFSPSPLLYNGMVYFTAPNSDSVYKVNGASGALVKKFLIPGGGTVIATPVADGKQIFVCAMNDTLYAMDTGTGAVNWRFGADAALISSPVVYSGSVYCASTQGAMGGHVFCVNELSGPDPSTGFPTWVFPDIDYYDSAIFVSSPVICPPFLYIGSKGDSNMYCIYLTPPTTMTSGAGITLGQERWQYKTLGGIYSSPAAFGGLVVFGCDDFNVYCLDTTYSLLTGTAGLIWRYSTGSEVWSSPVVSSSQQVVYIGSRDYFLYALNVAGNTSAKQILKWRFKSSGLINSSPLAYGGDVYIGSYDKNLYAVDTATGTLKWQFNTNNNIECSPVIDDLTGNNYNTSQISGFMRQPNR